MDIPMFRNRLSVLGKTISISLQVARCRDEHNVKKISETLVTSKVSLVLPPIHMEAHDRILNKASELFVRYGIRSITMDEIALQLGISKKTIYQFYADKNELVEAVIVQILDANEQCCNKDRSIAANAIHEVFLAMEMVQEMFEHMNPSVLYDLERYHPKAYERFTAYKYKFLHHLIRENLERGIQEELYRDDLNIAVMTALRLETMMVPFTLNFNAKLKTTLAELQQQVIEHFLFGIASLKGYKLILKYKAERTKKISHDGKAKIH